MKRHYIKPRSMAVQCYDPLMQNELILPISCRNGEGEASRESKFGIEESDTEDHENFWDE